MRRPLVAGLILSVWSLWTGAADARPHLQFNEVRLNLDVQIASQANETRFDILWMRSFTPFERRDPIPGPLRRFLLHPSELWLRARRVGSTNLDTQTGAYAGAAPHLLDGRLVLKGEAGVERDDVHNDPKEEGYWTTPITLGVGSYVTPFLSVGVVYLVRPVISATVGNSGDAERSGYEDETALALGTALGDRVLLDLRAGWHRASWDFATYSQGPFTIGGVRVTANATFLLSRTIVLALRARWTHEDWNNQRDLDFMVTRVGPDVERTVSDFDGGLDFVYWFEDRVAFNIGASGGFIDDRPIVNAPFRGFFGFALGVTSRY